jgi:hypothetical protein
MFDKGQPMTETVDNVDAEENSTEQVLERGRSQRDEMMRAIVERRQAEIRDSGESEPVTREQGGSLPLRRDGDQWFTKVKVNGEEHEVPFDDVVKRYQKDSAADRRLAQASERQKQLDAYAARLEQRERDLMQKARPPVPKPGQARPSARTTAAPSNDLDAKALTEALYSGDEDAATKAFAKLLARTQQAAPAATPAVNESVIAERVQKRIEEEAQRRKAMQFERDRVDALERFNEEYKDIIDDPYLRDMADSETVRIMNEQGATDPWEIMKASGDKVREWLASRSGGTVNRSSRKRTATAVTGAARARASLVPEDNAPKTASDIIADIKRARGQI